MINQLLPYVDIHVGNIKIAKSPRLYLLLSYEIGEIGDHIALGKGRYTTILTQGKLNSYLREIDVQAIELMESLISSLADQRGIDEKLKEQNALLWVTEMNNIKASAEEIVLKEVIYK